MTELGDDLLVAHVDGQLARDQSRAIERVLESDPVTGRRAKALQAAHERLEVAFDALLAGEFTALTGLPPHERMEIADEPDRPPLIRARKGLLLAAIGCLALGAAAGYGWRGAVSPHGTPTVAYDPRTTSSISPGQGDPTLRPFAHERGPQTGAAPATSSWRDDAWRAYALYGREWLETSLESQANLDFVRFQLSTVLGVPVTIPDLAGEGFEFRRASILRHEGEPVAQIAYLGATGAPVALYAKADREGPPLGPSLHATGGIGMAAWTGGGFSYLLAARLPEDRLVRLADLVRTQTDSE